MSRRTSTLPLSQDQIAALVNAGYTRLEDLRKAQPARLAQDLDCTHEEALRILKASSSDISAPSLGDQANNHGKNQSTDSTSQAGSEEIRETGVSSSSMIRSTPFQSKFGSSALKMLKSSRKRAGIVTFSAEMDKQMFSSSGGVPIGQMTEFCGAPGMGKTQICMQLACNVGIPKLMGGVAGSCVYIDTEGSFMVDRVHQIAQALASHLAKNYKSLNRKKDRPTNSSTSSEPSSLDCSDIPSASNIMDKIYCFRVHDHAEQLAVVKILPNFIRDHPDVRLVVLDSVAFHFRHGFHNRYAERSRILSQLAQDLNRLADKARLAVVVTNHVTTRMHRQDGGGPQKDRDAYLAPALGESWSHAATNRVELFWNGKIRTARLTKSPSLGLISVPFQVVADGVRGMSHRPSNRTSKRSASTAKDTADSHADAHKRQRVC